MGSLSLLYIGDAFTPNTVHVFPYIWHETYYILLYPLGFRYFLETIRSF